MTKDKAIDLLDNLIGMVDDSQGNDYDEALRMGIEALRKYTRLDKVFDRVLEYYEQAVKDKYIVNPVAWALYQAWKEADEVKR